jgi:hypothetical protein
MRLVVRTAVGPPLVAETEIDLACDVPGRIVELGLGQPPVVRAIEDLHLFANNRQQSVVDVLLFRVDRNGPQSSRPRATQATTAGAGSAANAGSSCFCDQWSLRSITSMTDRRLLPDPWVKRSEAGEVAALDLDPPILTSFAPDPIAVAGINFDLDLGLIFCVSDRDQSRVGSG